MAEVPDGCHIPAVHVGVGWRGQAATSLMDFGLLKVLCSTLTTLPLFMTVALRAMAVVVLLLLPSNTVSIKLNY